MSQHTLSRPHHLRIAATVATHATASHSSCTDQCRRPLTRDSRQSSDEWVILKIAVYTTPCQLSLLAVGMVKTGLDLFSRAALSSWPGLRRYTGSARPNLEPPASGCSLARQ